jgi:arylsulfatase A
VPGATLRPDIVFILADDMGYGDVQVLNPQSRIPTPNMNRLAGEGTSFTDAHSSSSVCTSSRYSILTGRYCWRTALPRGVFAGYEPPLIEPTRLTMAGMLRDAGYRTVAVGKWHLGLGYGVRAGYDAEMDRPLPWPTATRDFEEHIEFTQPLTGGPLALGFDEFFGTSGCPTCQPPYAWIEGDRFVEPPSIYEESFPYTGRPGMRSPSWQHQEADPAIIARAVQTVMTSDPTHPLFLYVGLDAPHEPCVDDVVPHIARGKSRAGPRGDLVWMVDHAVGEIMDAIAATERTDDTLFVVSSDNGALAGDRILDERGKEIYRTYGHRSSGPWRGHKAHIWEGGHREPLLMRWPNHIAAGISTDALACLSDLTATFAGIVGATLPADVAEDSFDLSDVLLNAAPSPRTSVIHHSQRGVFAVRAERWKAIFGTTGSGGWPPPEGGPPVDGADGQLYDLDDDPAETSNLWYQRPDIVERLAALLLEARTSTRTAPLRS